MTAATDMPARIGRFRIESMLGRGAMGVVYKGHDENIERPVAVKLIRADLLDGEERESYFRRFRNEAKIAGRCVHANIVGLYDFSFHEGNPYLVMEYVNGIGLQQALPRGSQRSEDEVLPIALQVLDALQYAHDRGIVHRDIKPANILVSPDSKLKITDFGISRLSSTELTMTPLLIGTPSYMSPEQCMGSALDGRSDLFSLGCVLYELLAGRRPFTGANYTDTILGIISRPHTPLQEIRDDLSPGLIEAIDQALAKKPEDRFPNADAFGRALEQVAGGSYRPRSLPPVFAEMVAMSQSGETGEPTVVAGVDPTVTAATDAQDDDADTVVIARSAIFPPDVETASPDSPPPADAVEPPVSEEPATEHADDTVAFQAPEAHDDAPAAQHETAEPDAGHPQADPEAGDHAPAPPIPPEAAEAEEAARDEGWREEHEETLGDVQTEAGAGADADPHPLDAPPAVLPPEDPDPTVPTERFPLPDEHADTLIADLPAHAQADHPPATPFESADNPESPDETALSPHNLEPAHDAVPPDHAETPAFEPDDTLVGAPPQAAPLEEDAWPLEETHPQGHDLSNDGPASDGHPTDGHTAPAPKEYGTGPQGGRDWAALQEWTAACLVQVIGPIGPIVVSRLRDDDHPESLVDDCALFIRDEGERATFRRLVAAGPSVGQMAGGHAR